MSQLIKVLVNNRKVMVDKNSSILDAIKKVGHVPTLCYNGRYKPRGTCRICLVKTNKSGKLVEACNRRVEEGLEITTDSPDLKSYRETDLQLLLSRHPNECMTCEASGGNCKLQNIIQEFGISDDWGSKDVRKSEEHIYQDHTSPCIERDLRKCIECGLCVQACGRDQGQDINAIGFVDRGSKMLPVTVFDLPLKDTGCIDCGQCTNGISY
jgi:NADH-quinone oxidoreductase subunit G